MKLRIRGDAIRLRLTRSEVDALRDRGRVEEATSFPGGASFRYALELGDATAATFDGGAITVRVAREEARAWCTNEEAISLAAEVGPLRLLVEKDFACVKPRSDDDPADMYPHPQATRSAPE